MTGKVKLLVAAILASCFVPYAANAADIAVIGGKPDAATLIRTAIGQAVDEIAIPNWVPQVEDEEIKAALAIPQAGKSDSVMLGSFDYDDTVLERIQDGTQLFAIDQQPYLQSLLSVTLLASHIDFGTDLPVHHVATGSAIIDVSNIEVTLAGVAKGV